LEVVGLLVGLDGLWTSLGGADFGEEVVEVEAWGVGFADFEILEWYFGDDSEDTFGDFEGAAGELG